MVCASLKETPEFVMFPWATEVYFLNM